jgi:hypothetical protein
MLINLYNGKPTTDF